VLRLSVPHVVVIQYIDPRPRSALEDSRRPCHKDLRSGTVLEFAKMQDRPREVMSRKTYGGSETIFEVHIQYQRQCHQYNQHSPASMDAAISSMNVVTSTTIPRANQSRREIASRCQLENECNKLDHFFRAVINQHRHYHAEKREGKCQGQCAKTKRFPREIDP